MLGYCNKTSHPPDPLSLVTRLRGPVGQICQFASQLPLIFSFDTLIPRMPPLFSVSSVLTLGALSGPGCGVQVETGHTEPCDNDAA